MPILQELLPKLSKAKVLTTLDVKDGFYQIGLDDERSKKTALKTTSLIKYQVRRSTNPHERVLELQRGVDPTQPHHLQQSTSHHPKSTIQCVELL